MDKTIFYVQRTKIRMTDFLYETFRETVKSTSFKYWEKNSKPRFLYTDF